MRKILSLVLCLMLAVACIPAMAEEAAPVEEIEVTEATNPA